MCEALAKATVTYSISPRGRVVDVAGIDEIVDKSKPGAAAFISPVVSRDGMIKAFQQELDAIPRTPVRPGYTWMRSELLPARAGQSLTFERRYEYVGEVTEDGRTFDKIELADQSVVFSTPEGPLTDGTSELTVQTSEGTVLIDRKLGRIARRDLASHITGSIRYRFQGQEITSEVELKYEQRTAVE
jgi:hypothetical protein